MVTQLANLGLDLTKNRWKADIPIGRSAAQTPTSFRSEEIGRLGGEGLARYFETGQASGPQLLGMANQWFSPNSEVMFWSCPGSVDGELLSRSFTAPSPQGVLR